VQHNPRPLPPSASLDTQESSYDEPRVDQIIARAKESRSAKVWDAKTRGGIAPRPARPVELAFRHGGWAANRKRIYQAMVDNGESPSALERFANCGASCEVSVSVDGQRAKLAARYCKHRFCVPCMKAKARIIKCNLGSWTEGLDPLMITLTLRPSEKPLGAILSHLLKSFARLRHSTRWLKSVDAGAYCVEITRGEKGDHWHVHLHAICLGGYFPQNELSAAWAVASRGSTIVHITRCSTGRKGIDYASEYASKGWASDCLGDPAWIRELLSGLRGRRLFGTFGGWRGRRVESEPVTGDGFRRVGSLMEIANHAARGEQWAIGICRLIGVAVVSDHGRISFVRSKRFPQPREESTLTAPRDEIPRDHGP
jgi:hypothetical protein